MLARLFSGRTILRDVSTTITITGLMGLGLFIAWPGLYFMVKQMLPLVHQILNLF